jgi:hypothetical protein
MSGKSNIKYYMQVFIISEEFPLYLNFSSAYKFEPGYSLFE